MAHPTTDGSPGRKPRKGKAPAFQFYPADWLADARVAAMTLEEEGAYIRLLCFCWREGSLPPEPSTLARLLKVSTDKMAELWSRIEPCFRTGDDGRLRQRRLDLERMKQRAFSRLQSDRRATGIRNALERKQQAVDRTATETRPESTLHLQSSSSEGRGRAENGDIQTLSSDLPMWPDGHVEGAQARLERWRTEFDQLWKTHPPRKGRKRGRPEAWDAYRALRPTADLARLITEGHNRALAGRDWQEGIVEDLSRWLKHKRWQDEYSAPADDWKTRFLAKGDDE